MKYRNSLIILFFSIIAIKLLIIPFIYAPYTFHDEVTYAETARNFIFRGEYTPQFYPPLYPLLLSSAYLFDDPHTSYIGMKIINVLISTLIIFPAYFLSREFLSSRLSIFIGLFSVLNPEFFTHTFTLMTENLFYPLVMFSVLFMVKAIKENSRKYDLLAGVTCSLAVFTKMLGGVLLLSYLIFLLYRYFSTFQTTSLRLRENIKSFFQKHGSSLSILTLTIPYLIAPESPDDRLVAHDVSRRISSIDISSFFEGLSLHINLLILLSGVIFFILTIALLLNFRKIYDNNLKSFLIFTLIFAVVSISTGTIFLHSEKGVAVRYIGFLLPFFLILGFRYIVDFGVESWKKLLIPLLFTSSIPITLIFCSMNYVEIGALWIIAYENIVRFLIVATILISIWIFVTNIGKKKELTIRNGIIIVLVILLLVNISSVFLVSIHTHQMYDYGEMGRWLQENGYSDSVVVFDSDSGVNIDSDIRALYYSTKFWKNGDVIIGEINNPDAAFIITEKSVFNSNFIMDSPKDLDLSLFRVND